MQGEKGILQSPSNWSTREFLASYDVAHEKRKQFHETHVRETFLVRKDLHDRLNSICKKRHGFKTKFINFALEKCLNELWTEEKPEANAVKRTSSNVGELTREEVREEVVKACTDYKVQEDLQDIILAFVFDILLPQDAETTTMRNPAGRFLSPPQGEKRVCDYATARTAVKKYVKYLSAHINEVQQTDLGI